MNTTMVSGEEAATRKATRQFVEDIDSRRSQGLRRLPGSEGDADPRSNADDFTVVIDKL